MTERKSHWQAVYRDKSSREVSWYQAEPAVSLQLIDSCELSLDAAIIDIGGGASVLVDYLTQRGYTNLAVLDISANALAIARARLGAAADNIAWYEADITQFRAPQPVVLWHDRAVFHFLTEAADRRAYIDSLKGAVIPGGYVVLSAFAIGGPEKCSGLPVVQYDAAKLSAELGDEFHLLDQRSELHQTPAGQQQAFNYFVFQRVAGPR